MLKWCDSYLLHIPELDMQHKKLFDIGEEAEELLNSCNYTDIDVIKVLTKLKDYSEYHFEQEEILMLRNNDRNIRSHAALHRELTAEVDRLIEEANTIDNMKTLEKLLALAIDYILMHVAKYDMCIRRKGEPQPKAY